jgi:hypothetical protein
MSLTTPPDSNIGQELANVPFAQLLGGVGIALAEAQLAMDMVGMQIAKMMSGTTEEFDEQGVRTEADTRVSFGKNTSTTAVPNNKYSLLELGFSPTFYQFVDTVVEIKVSITISTQRTESGKEGSFEFGAKAKVFKGELDLKGSSVSAQYANKYDYRAEASSMVRTKIVPLPPPAILEERIRQYIAPPTTP